MQDSCIKNKKTTVLQETCTVIMQSTQIMNDLFTKNTQVVQEVLNMKTILLSGRHVLFFIIKNNIM